MDLTCNHFKENTHLSASLALDTQNGNWKKKIIIKVYCKHIITLNLVTEPTQHHEAWTHQPRLELGVLDASDFFIGRQFIIQCSPFILYPCKTQNLILNIQFISKICLRYQTFNKGLEIGRTCHTILYNKNHIISTAISLKSWLVSIYGTGQPVPYKAYRPLKVLTNRKIFKPYSNKNQTQPLGSKYGNHIIHFLYIEI